MSKKKSYMDHKNIMTESFLSKLLKKLSDGVKNLEKAAKNRKVANDPKVKAAWADVAKKQADAESAIEKALAKYGSEYTRTS